MCFSLHATPSEKSHSRNVQTKRSRFVEHSCFLIFFSLRFLYFMVSFPQAFQSSNLLVAFTLAVCCFATVLLLSLRQWRSRCLWELSASSVIIFLFFFVRRIVKPSIVLCHLKNWPSCLLEAGADLKSVSLVRDIWSFILPCFAFLNQNTSIAKKHWVNALWCHTWHRFPIFMHLSRLFSFGKCARAPETNYIYALQLKLKESVNRNIYEMNHTESGRGIIGNWWIFSCLKLTRSKKRHIH